MWFVAQPGNRLTQFVPEFIQIVTAHILEFDLLEILQMPSIGFNCPVWIVFNHEAVLAVIRLAGPASG